MSIALMYDTSGRLAREPELCVVMVRTDKSPNDILAGTASKLIQNDTHDNITIKALGINS
jgi:hypothetical protein